MNHASQVVRALVTRCHPLVLAARCVILISVLLAIADTGQARSRSPEKTVAQGPPVTAGTRAEPCQLQHLDENSDFLFVPDTFGPRATYRRTWLDTPRPDASAHCAR
jgi:hypothetical protein